MSKLRHKDIVFRTLMVILNVALLLATVYVFYWLLFGTQSLFDNEFLQKTPAQRELQQGHQSTNYKGKDNGFLR